MVKSPESRPRGRPRPSTTRPTRTPCRRWTGRWCCLTRLAQSSGLTLSELAQQTGQAAATVYRALVTLQAHGMVEVEEPGQLWHVGGGAFRVGSAFLRRTKVVERARQPMDALMRDTGRDRKSGRRSRRRGAVS